jgi:hypothetical protein
MIQAKWRGKEKKNRGNSFSQGRADSQKHIRVDDDGRFDFNDAAVHEKCALALASKMKVGVQDHMEGGQRRERSRTACHSLNIHETETRIYTITFDDEFHDSDLEEYFHISTGVEMVEVVRSHIHCNLELDRKQLGLIEAKPVTVYDSMHQLLATLDDTHVEVAFDDVAIGSIGLQLLAARIQCTGACPCPGPSTIRDLIPPPGVSTMVKTPPPTPCIRYTIIVFDGCLREARIARQRSSASPARSTASCTAASCPASGRARSAPLVVWLARAFIDTSCP